MAAPSDSAKPSLTRTCRPLALTCTVPSTTASLVWAFARLDETEVWAMTARINTRSRAVMERLDMRYRPDCDFDHPAFEPGHPLRQHIVYAIDRPQ